MSLRLRRLWAVPILLLLLWAVGYGTGEALHARLLVFGEHTWPGYAQLRIEPIAPNCNRAVASPAPASGGDDFLDDLLGEEPPPLEDSDSAAAAAQRCRDVQKKYQTTMARRTGWLLPYVSLERTLASVSQWGMGVLRHTLVLLLLLCAITASAFRSHIALRPSNSREQHRVSQWGQLIAHALLLHSFYSQWQSTRLSSVAEQHGALPVLWFLGLASMATVNVLHLLRPPSDATPIAGSSIRGLLSIPLYALMCIVSGFYFLAVEGHAAGLAIYLQQLTEHAQLYLHVGLYVWIGMLVKRTALARLSFDVLRSFRLPSVFFVFAVVAAAAIPTAYSGASGIFVIAAGAVIYRELRRAGARQRLALAATALSGSLGVVLSPCLLVVIIASLNKQVTTNDLYGWGWKVYALTSALFLVALLVVRQTGEQPEDGTLEEPTALDKSLPEALQALAPYLVITLGVLGCYHLALNMSLGEHTAPVVLPVLLCTMIAFEAHRGRSKGTNAPGVWQRTGVELMVATRETSQHIGALLSLMALSICLGGVVVRGELMNAVPQTLGSVWLAMSLLLVLLVLIGMLMDPYGAVILVSASIADVAYRNGIDPVQFWMVVLVAFELGYLTPPVALNHLLTRHVVGEALLRQEEAGFAASSLYAKYEDKILPVMVLGTALLIVAYVPLLWSQ